MLLHCVDHWWWATEQDLAFSLGWWEAFLDHLFVDESDTAVPASWRRVENVEHPEPSLSVLVLLLDEFVDLLLHEDVVCSDIGVDKINLCSVAWVLKNGANDLEGVSTRKQPKKEDTLAALA